MASETKSETLTESKEYDHTQEDDMSLDSLDSNAVVKLKSKEGDILEVNQKAAFMSTLVRRAVENAETSDVVVDLQHINTLTIQKIIEYLIYHATVAPREIIKPLISCNMKELVDDFDFQIIESGQEMVFNLMLAANYMDIQPLLMLTCAQIASLIKNKTPEQIRATFNIRNDYTPEDEAEVQRQFGEFF